MEWPIRMFRLVSEPDAPGLYCSDDGLMLGGAPLLREGDAGFEPRPAEDLNGIFDAAYEQDSGIDAASRYLGLCSVARALNRDDVGLATIASLLLNLPDVDEDGMTRLSALNGLSKANYNEAETRDARGWWAESGGGNPNIKPVQWAMPIPLFPPPFPGTAGAPKPKKDDDLVFPYIPSSDANSSSNANTQANASVTENTDKPEVCPASSYEVTSVGRTDEELHYQAQINELLLGWHVVFNGIGYDGCDDTVTPLFFLEAKKSNGWLMTVPEMVRPLLKEYKDTMKQAFSQNYGSAGHIVEWHYSDQETSEYWAREFRKAGLNNLVVKFTPYDKSYEVKKLYSEIIFKNYSLYEYKILIAGGYR